MKGDSMSRERVSSWSSRFSSLFALRGPARTRAQTRRSFTLVELLVVVTIIALLVAILVPAVLGAMRDAKQVVCSSNMHQIAVGLTAYLGHWENQYFPPWSHPTIFFGVEWFSSFDNRQNLSDVAGGETMLYYCPLSNPDFWPENSQVPADAYNHWTKWAERYHVQTSQYRHTMEETRILVGMNPTYTNFSGTNNPKGASPREYPNSDRAAVAFDYHFIEKARWSVPLGQWVYWDPGTIVYGDGHTERPGQWENTVNNYFATFMY